jgi:hypothetical protein
VLRASEAKDPTLAFLGSLGLRSLSNDVADTLLKPRDSPSPPPPPDADAASDSSSSSSSSATATSATNGKFSGNNISGNTNNKDGSGGGGGGGAESGLDSSLWTEIVFRALTAPSKALPALLDKVNGLCPALRRAAQKPEILMAAVSNPER